eukprot:5706307-Pyramimonas_sp.AAC.1
MACSMRSSFSSEVQQEVNAAQSLILTEFDLVKREGDARMAAIEASLEQLTNRVNGQPPPQSWGADAAGVDTTRPWATRGAARNCDKLVIDPAKDARELANQLKAMKAGSDSSARGFSSSGSGAGGFQAP